MNKKATDIKMLVKQDRNKRKSKWNWAIQANER